MNGRAMRCENSTDHIGCANSLACFIGGEQSVVLIAESP